MYTRITVVVVGIDYAIFESINAISIEHISIDNTVEPIVVDVTAFAATPLKTRIEHLNEDRKKARLVAASHFALFKFPQNIYFVSVVLPRNRVANFVIIQCIYQPTTQSK